MKKAFTLIIAVFITFQIQAQISAFFGTSTFSADKWDTMMQLPPDEIITAANIFTAPRSIYKFTRQPMAGLSYSIPFKKVGISLVPELNYVKFRAFGWDNTILPNQERMYQTIELHNIALLINSNIYIFNLKGECKKETFGADVKYFKRGFHIQTGPGIVLSHKSIEQYALGVRPSKSTVNSLNFAVVAGIGFDLKVSKRLMISHFVRYKWIAPQDWVELSDILTSQEPVHNNSSSINNLEYGLRLTYWSKK